MCTLSLIRAYLEVSEVNKHPGCLTKSLWYTHCKWKFTFSTINQISKPVGNNYLHFYYTIFWIRVINQNQIGLRNFEPRKIQTRYTVTSKSFKNHMNLPYQYCLHRPQKKWEDQLLVCDHVEPPYVGVFCQPEK